MLSGAPRTQTPTAPAPPASRLGERPLPPSDALVRAWLWAASAASGLLGPLRARRLMVRAGRVGRHRAALADLDGPRLVQERVAALARVRRSGSVGMPAEAALAFVAEAAGPALGLDPHPVQLAGALGLLDGMVVEMATGEGKSLTAALAASVAASAGSAVHVVTVNDYLARRDADRFAPLFAALGLTGAVVVADMDRPTRRAAYACDIVYVSNKELAFDYLHDRLAGGSAGAGIRGRLDALVSGDDPDGRSVLRGLHFAIVDEVDSALVDEARTPLVVSGPVPGNHEESSLRFAAGLASRLVEGRDYRVQPTAMRVDLTDAGRETLDAEVSARGGLWRHEAYREDLVRMALVAVLFYRRDEHYVVGSGRVRIVDEYTGRIMGDRFWSDGLHQLIEIKEGCEPSRPTAPRARITYQRFFRRYRRLAGMTGTAREVAGELRRVYGLDFVRIPTHRTVRRRHLPTTVCANAEEKWRRVAARAAELQRAGRPVLVGTRSVSASRAAAAALDDLGVAHAVLNAVQDRAEAKIVAMAGQAGRVTVATNMAGRGTDIALGSGVAERGGLHVIVTELHEARRIDRQLAGRAARQGDPGSVEFILACDDALLTGGRVPAGRLPFGPAALRLLYRWRQIRAERRHAAIRARLVRADEQTARSLAFSVDRE